jgi:hypothetical protein
MFDMLHEGLERVSAGTSTHQPHLLLSKQVPLQQQQ